MISGHTDEVFRAYPQKSTWHVKSRILAV